MVDHQSEQSPPATRGPRRRILFFAEGATLAHVARPFVVARALDPERFEVVFARPDTFGWLTKDAPFEVRPLACQATALFTRRLEHGLPLYDLPTLRRYVADDLALIDTEQPDVIVGDFRLSLSVSARLRSIPYATICDAYWSPERPLHPALPALAFTRFTPITLAQGIFRLVSPLAMSLHARPIEQLRAVHGLPSLAHDLRLCYTDADLRLFANFPDLFPEVGTGTHAAFIGPIAWSPEPTKDTPSFDEQNSAPLVYVTMGSSGDPEVLGTLVPLLEASGARVVVASAGKKLPAGLESQRTRIFDYLSGGLVCRHANLVVCNGGSPTTNQALGCGVPVLGIARNMDQFLNMQAIERFGAGILVRADRAGRGPLSKAIHRLITEIGFRERAQALATSAANQARDVRLNELLAGLTIQAGAAAEHSAR